MMASILRKAWQGLPEGWRRSAHLSWDHALTAITPALMATVWRRGRPAAPPLLVAGLFSSSTGLGQGARLFVQALADACEVATLDVGPTLHAPADLGEPRRPARPPEGGVVVTHFNPTELVRFLPRTLGRALRGRRHIGYWAWELPTIPQSWLKAFAYVDEVWCPSSFTAEAVRKAAPAGMPIHVVPHPIFMTPRLEADRSRFGLPIDACITLMALDLKSTAARKNPWGGLEAYRRAMPEPSADVRLVCKLSGARQEPTLFAALKQEAETRSDIVLLSEDLSGEDMTRLIASADILLSLHRAEGFGLLPAEAMWLGKCVVATAWSGNMDFMDEASSVLVGWRPIPVEDPQALYSGGWWADPDLDAAATALRALIADPGARAALGARAQARAEEVFDRRKWLSHVSGMLGQPRPPGAERDDDETGAWI
jgi:glycosyltransferase involved in cell wall biosynthesis